MEADKTQTGAAVANPRMHPILVVDDDPNFRRIVQFTLEMRGYGVLAAGSPEAALEIAARTPNIRLLITDVIMPAMNGAELARQLREMQPGVAVIYISGFPLQAMAGMDVSVDAANFLQKPFPPAKLDALIKTILAAP